MELSAEQPVVPRHAQRDPAGRPIAYSGRHKDGIWQVFAQPRHGLLRRVARWRTTPRPAPASRSRRPACQTGTITGTVTDCETGDPIAGVRGSPLPSRARRRASTRRRRPTPMAATRSARFRAAPTRSCRSRAAGYDAVIERVTVDAATVTHDAELERDWASAAGGAADRLDFTGPDFGDPCGPVERDRPVATCSAGARSSDLGGGQPGPNTPKKS